MGRIISVRLITFNSAFAMRENLLIAMFDEGDSIGRSLRSCAVV